MNKSENDSTNTNGNPWKIGAIATAGAVLLLVAAGITFAAFNGGMSSNEPAVTVAQAAAPRAAASAPVATAKARENCDQYRLDAQRDNMRVAKDGAIGAAVGAGTGAAGGAIVKGGKGAGKGAGIGAVIGAVAGGAYGMTHENDRVDDAERAYQDCLNRNL